MTVPDTESPSAVGSTRRLTTAQNMLTVIDRVAMAGGPVSISTLAAQLGWSRAKTHQYLHTGMDSGWIEQDKVGRFSVSYHLTVLSRMQDATGNVVELVRATMQQLAADTGESVSFAVEDSGRMFIIERSDPVGGTNGLNFKMEVSITKSPSAIVLLASMSASYRDALRARGVALAEEAAYDEARANGVAASISNWLGHDVAVVAVPVFVLGVPIGALSVIAPSARMDGTRQSAMASRLREAASVIAQQAAQGRRRTP